MSTLSAGECFGETAILTGEPRNATVQCGSSVCNVVSVTRDDFLRLMARSATVHEDMRRVVARRSTRQVTQARSQLVGRQR